MRRLLRSPRPKPSPTKHPPTRLSPTDAPADEDADVSNVGGVGDAEPAEQPSA